MILNNTVTGSDEADAIGLWNGSYDTVIGNNVSDFTVDPKGAQPATSRPRLSLPKGKPWLPTSHNKTLNAVCCLGGV